MQGERAGQEKVDGVRARVPSFGKGGGAADAMECERWGEEDEVEMDVDVSAEEELHFISEISRARGTLTLDSPATLQAVSSAKTTDYTVSMTF